MKQYLLPLLGSVLVLIACSTKNLPQKRAKKPNFLFIMVDDQAFDALGYSGRYAFLKTPHIDRLKEEGAHIENFFVTQSICSPSRASFLTGTYPHIHGVNQNNRHVDPNWEAFPSYASHLQDAGYETAHIGKIHMAHKSGKNHIRPGFDYWFSFNGQGEYFNPLLNDNGREYRGKGYMTDILTDKAIAWLTRKREADKPFSLNVWHKAVHEPHLPAPRHEDLYKGEKLPAPPYNTHLETFRGKPTWQRRKTFGFKWKNGQEIPAELPPPKWPIRKYKNMQMLRCIQAIDESVARLLETLEELGELENTVIIYSSDNGYFMGEHTFQDKRLAYENSMRVPLLIRYPKLIGAGTSISELCLNIDIAPTILEMADVPQPPYMQGESMLNLLIGKQKTDWRKSFLFEYYVDDAFRFAGPNMIAVRTDSLKLVDAFVPNDIDELYNLKEDPGEMNNLIDDPTYEEIELKLREEVKYLMTKYKYNPDRDWWLRKVK